MCPRVTVLCVFAAILVPVIGCGVDVVTNQLPASRDELEAVVLSDNLDPQEKRAELADLGLSELQINSLLRDERIANQFGGTLGTAFDKVAGEEFSALTPDEIQIYADEASDVDSELSVSYSDAEAQAIADFFEETGVNDPDALETFLDDPANEPPASVSSVDLRGVFVDFDPNELIESLP